MESIEYAIVRRPKRRTASIVIRPDNRVEVLAPSRMPTALIAEFVQNKRQWIDKKLHYNKTVRTQHTAKTFTHGETFYLLGNAYALQITQGKRSVQINDHKLLLSHPKPESEAMARQLTQWYREQAEAHFRARCSIFSEIVGKQPASVDIKAYKSRWGSCHPDGRIYFNWRLIMAPDWVIDDVVVHELCHLIHPNHSREFWTLVESISPNHQQVKIWLKSHGLSLDL